MKTIFLSATLLFATLVPARGESGQPTLFNRIREQMRVPDNMKHNVSTERVYVLFTFDADGKARVLEIATARPEIRASVEKQFESIDFTGTEKVAGTTYSIWLTFKVL